MARNRLTDSAVVWGSDRVAWDLQACDWYWTASGPWVVQVRWSDIAEAQGSVGIEVTQNRCCWLSVHTRDRSTEDRVVDDPCERNRCGYIVWSVERVTSKIDTTTDVADELIVDHHRSGDQALVVDRQRISHRARVRCTRNRIADVCGHDDPEARGERDARVFDKHLALITRCIAIPFEVRRQYISNGRWNRNPSRTGDQDRIRGLPT